MKFCRQPNGKFLKYSNVTDTIDMINLDEEQLLEEVIAELAWTIADRYFSLFRGNACSFDDVLSLKPSTTVRLYSRKKWVDLFAVCGANEEQISKVNESIDMRIQYLKNLKDLKKVIKDKDESIEDIERQIQGLERRLYMEKDLHFKIMYGIKSFNSDGSEQPYDTSESAIYTSLEDAIKDQHFWFDSMCEEMKQHRPQRRKREQAFCYIQAVANVSEDNPDGEPVYPGGDDESLSSVMIQKLDATYMTMRGWYD